MPLPYGNGEQELNARAVVEAGGELLVADAAFDAAYVADTVPPLAHDTERLSALGPAAAGLVPRDADEQLVRIALETARSV